MFFFILNFKYNAKGNKLKKSVTESATNTNIDYLDTSMPLSTNGFQYTNENLEFFPTAEGYVKAVALDVGGSSYHYVYNYTDHTSTPLSTGLGNIRLKYTAHPQTGEPQSLEENPPLPRDCIAWFPKF